MSVSPFELAKKFTSSFGQTHLARPNRLQNRLFWANVTKPAQALKEPIFQHIALSVTDSRGVATASFSAGAFNRGQVFELRHGKITLRRDYRSLAAEFRHRTPTAPDRAAAAPLPFFEARKPASSRRWARVDGPAQRFGGGVKPPNSRSTRPAKAIVVLSSR